MAKTATLAVLVIVLGSLLISAPPAAAQGILDLQITGPEVTGRIVLPGGIEASLRITFEQVTGLTEENLGLSAQLVSPLDLGILSRLPLGSGVTLPSAFPVLLTIDPPPTSTFAFRGVATVEIYTTALPYTLGSTLRLFAASPGGAFENVTAWDAPGSFRIGAVHPEFAREQAIVYDPRPIQAVADQQLAGLESALAAQVGTIGPTVWSQLDGLLQQVRGHFDNDSTNDARTALGLFEAKVVEHSGTEIPDEWNAAGTAENVAGDLRSRAASLDYSLSRESGGLLGGLL